MKVRGFRIELGEIEAALDEHPVVRQSAVVAREDGEGKRLVGVCGGRSGSDGCGIEEAFRKRVPEYMVPESILILEEMPVTANGKIDRKKLPDSVNVHSALDATYVTPQTELEHAIAAVWKELLQAEHVTSTIIYSI